MPVTRGSGNPVWTWDETLLALDLLYRHGRPIDKGHADTTQLSQLLRHANIYPADKRKDNFRNPDGVALKLQNLFSAMTPGRRLGFSETDKLAVEAFPNTKKAELSKLSQAIRTAIHEGTDGPEDAVIAPEDTFVEGRVLTAKHRSRDRRLRRQLLASRKGRELKCEMCDLVASGLPRQMQESLFEAHHVIPLASSEGLRTTRVADAALLCACCHRFIHRLISSEKRWVGIAEGRSARLA